MKAWWRETWTRNLFWDSASLAHCVLSDQSFGRDKEAPCNSGTREALKLMILKGYLVTFYLYSNPWLTAADFLESLCIGEWLASGELTVATLTYLLHLTHFPAHTSWEDGIFLKKKKNNLVSARSIWFSQRPVYVLDLPLWSCHYHSVTTWWRNGLHCLWMHQERSNRHMPPRRSEALQSAAKRQN